MAVSANTLFHFTSIEGLKGILRSGGFFYQYSDEHFENILPIKSHYRFTYIPMTCFCDLTIMQLSNDPTHRNGFGDFGIGLTKTWGIKKGISPVMYVHESSEQTRRLNQLIEEIGVLRRISSRTAKEGVATGGPRSLYENTEERAVESIDLIEQELIDSFKYIKPYKGKWHKGKRRRKERVYYNEREWRYCPLKDEYPVLSEKLNKNKDKIAEINQKMKRDLLTFEAKDVKFILVKDKSHIAVLDEVIRKLKIDRKLKSVLSSKIITFQEIEEDFG